MTPEIVISDERPETSGTAFLAVLLPEGALPPSLRALDASTGGAVSRLKDTGDFRGKRDDTSLLYPAAGVPRLLLVGLGTPDDRPTAIRRAAAVAARRAAGAGVTDAALWLAPEARADVSPFDAARLVAEGAGFGAWRFAELKRRADDARAELARLTILAPEDIDDAREGALVGVAVAEGQALARRLQVQPGNRMTPTMLADAATELATRHDFHIRVLDRAALVEEGMHALLAVAQGSVEEPRFIALEYRGTEDAPVVLVGKGVTFDSGGISIKPALSMEDMKYDMSGAAAVLGTFEMLGRLRPEVRVVGLIPSAENMPSGSAYKPGDVVQSHLGKTIEVINTDAEGRLLLVDALSYARRYQPAAVVDVATLTGAVVIALGHVAIGLMGNDDALLDEVRGAGERAGERAWPLPLWEEYRELMKSDIADIKNSGGRGAGTITAAWFLREFVEGFPWAHLDIAGTAWAERDDAIRAKGPTGMAVRLFCEFVLGRASR